MPVILICSYLYIGRLNTCGILIITVEMRSIKVAENKTQIIFSLSSAAQILQVSSVASMAGLVFKTHVAFIYISTRIFVKTAVTLCIFII